MTSFFPIAMHGGGDEIDLAPMVDIAFLLLTFFMMTTTFKTTDDVKVTLPTSTSTNKEPTEKYITVTIGDSATGNKIMVNMSSQKVRQDALGDILGGGDAGRAKALETKGFEIKKDDLYGVLNKARQSDGGQKVVFKCDKATKFGLVQEIMVIMKKVNFQDVQMMTTLEK